MRTPTGTPVDLVEEVEFDSVGPSGTRSRAWTRYMAHARRDLGMALGFALVTGAIYTAARLGQAGGLADDVRRVTGRDPIPLREFAEREKEAWSR